MLPVRAHGDGVRALANEALHDVAVPADWLVRREEVGQRLRLHVLPRNGDPAGRQERRAVLGPRHLGNRLPAEDTGPAAIPARPERPHGGDPGVALDFGEAFLPAPRLFGPARAARQAKPPRLVPE